MARTLTEALDKLPDDMILSDGGTDWTVGNLRAEIESRGSENSEYVIGGDHNDRTLVVRLDANGYQVSPPDYVEVILGRNPAGRR